MLDSMLEQMSREIDTLKDRDRKVREKDLEAKKNEVTLIVREMVNGIFDIAHEAYVHKQKNDSSEVDPRNWREWEQLFSEGADTKASSDETNVDFLELKDYLEN